MSNSRTFPSRKPTRRARLVAALVGLLAVTVAWAPGAVAATASAPVSPVSERSQDASSMTLSPGDPIYSDWARCTLGFNVTNGDDVFILTAGHCTSAGSYWYADPQQTVPIGPAVHSSFPGDDFGLIRYDNPDLFPDGGYSAGSAYVGQPVHTITPGTVIHGGVVTGLNATVNYGNGDVVYGLIQTNVCFETGTVASGVPLVGDSRQALGIASGGSGSCSSGGSSFFQPVTEALGALGLYVY